MLKYQVDSLKGLDESVHSFYEEKDGKYQLKVDGVPQGEDVTGLKTKIEELLGESKAAKAKARKAEEAARKTAEESARKNGDVEALENSWKEKLTKREKELQDQIDSLGGSITTMTVDNVALSLANELAVEGSAKVLLPHIKARLAAEQRDGKYQTVIRDAEGKPSASSLDDLKQEFANDPAFAHVIIGSKASGSGADGAKPGGGADKEKQNPKAEEARKRGDLTGFLQAQIK